MQRSTWRRTEDRWRLVDSVVAAIETTVVTTTMGVGEAAARER